MSHNIDLKVRDLTAADGHSAHLLDRTLEGDFHLLAQHDIAERSYVLAFDHTATWDFMHGAPNLAAFDVVRQPEQGTFSLRKSEHASLAFARKWLVERGCPPDALTLAWLRPADELTVRVEDRLQRAGDRYRVLDCLAMDGDATEAWTITVDNTSAELPIRLFLEEHHPGRDTYTVREGAFPSATVAKDWLAERPSSLPLAPEYLDTELKRTRAALARSSASATGPDSAAIVASAPAAAADVQPDRRRSL